MNRLDIRRFKFGPLKKKGFVKLIQNPREVNKALKKIKIYGKTFIQVGNLCYRPREDYLMPKECEPINIIKIGSIRFFLTKIPDRELYVYVDPLTGLCVGEYSDSPYGAVALLFHKLRLFFQDKGNNPYEDYWDMYFYIKTKVLCDFLISPAYEVKKCV